jgi:hypothetical protein
VYGYFATTVKSRRREMVIRYSWITDLVTRTGTTVLLCGDFNPRTLKAKTNEAPYLKTKFPKLTSLIYHLRLVPFLFYSYFGATPLKELDKNSDLGLVYPRSSTMKDRRVAGITIPFEIMGCVMDLVQTNLPNNLVSIQVYDVDDLSDHCQLKVSIK